MLWMQVAWKKATPVVSFLQQGRSGLTCSGAVLKNCRWVLSAGRSSDIVSGLYLRNTELRTPLGRCTHGWLFFFLLAQFTSTWLQPAVCCLQCLLVSFLIFWQTDSEEEQNFIFELLLARLISTSFLLSQNLISFWAHLWTLQTRTFPLSPPQFTTIRLKVLYVRSRTA